MSIINSFDTSDEIVKPELFTNDLPKLPEIAIVCFKYELIEEIKKNSDFEEFDYNYVAGEKLPIFRHKAQNVLLYKTIMGAPSTVGMMEEMRSRGVKKFIVFGSCGQLDSNLTKGAFIIPEEAYRDEGTSYHYMPGENEFVKVKTASKLANIFDELNVKYDLTKVWTTDALYRETKQKAKKMRELGCKVVDMECSSIMAMADFRNIDVYQFLYTDDTLESEEWDLRTLKDDRTFLLKECVSIALKVAKMI